MTGKVLLSFELIFAGHHARKCPNLSYVSGTHKKQRHPNSMLPMKKTSRPLHNLDLEIRTFQRTLASNNETFNAHALVVVASLRLPLIEHVRKVALAILRRPAGGRVALLRRRCDGD